MTESELIQKCKEKHRGAQQELFKRYAPDMLGICLRYTQHREEAKDVMHDGFVKVFTRIWSFREESSLKTWLSHIMVNTAIDHIKKHNRKYNYVRLDDEEHLLEVQEEDTLENTDIPSQISSEGALHLMQQLPDKYRIALNLYAVDGFTHRQIAEQLGVKEGTSKSLVARARGMMIELLNGKNLKHRQYERSKTG